MAERHGFLNGVVRLLMGVVLAGGLMACSTHDSAAEQAGRELVKNHAARDHDAAQVHGVQKGWVRVDSAIEHYCEKVIAMVNIKLDEYRAMNPGVLPRRGVLRTFLTINKWGKVEDIRIDNDEWSYPALTRLALRAIKNTKIPPMPAAVFSALLKQDHGRLIMEYIAVCPAPQ